MLTNDIWIYFELNAAEIKSVFKERSLVDTKISRKKNTHKKESEQMY